MAISKCMQNHAAAIECAVVCVLAAGLITMLACGILGGLRKLPMARIGARIMVQIPLTVIGAVLGGLVIVV